MQSLFKSSNNLAKKLEKVRILILDNSTQVTELVKNMLAEFGFTKVFSATNGFQGVQLLRDKKINLIITDWELKVSRSKESADNKPSADSLPLSGVDFVKRLRQSPSSPNPYIPIIMLAESVEQMQAASARDAGVNEVCVKPLNAKELCEMLISVIDKPRIFILAESYKGPCRRRKAEALPANQKDRRVREIRVIKCNESGGKR